MSGKLVNIEMLYLIFNDNSVVRMEKIAYLRAILLNYQPLLHLDKTM